MEYRLIRKNRKSVSIKIDPADLSVVVSAPLWLPKREIDAIVRNHARWIERQTAIVQARRRAEEAVTPEDIAETIWWMVNCPAHVNINRLEIMPLCQCPSGPSVKKGM